MKTCPPDLQKRTLFLSLLAYFPDDLIPLMADDSLGKIVWGPVSHTPIQGLTMEDSLAFVVQEPDGSYSLVFRGTNPFSISSWLRQDFQVSQLIRWTSIPADPENLKPQRLSRREWTSVPGISEGANLSLWIASHLEDQGKTLKDFFLDQPGPLVINVSGHSLGGLMASTFALWLKQHLPPSAAVSVCSYAGPSAGNLPYAEMYDQTLGSTSYIFAAGDPVTGKKLDAATIAWNQEEMASLPGLYAPLKMNGLTRIFYLFFKHQIKNRGYTQVGRNETLFIPSQVFNPGSSDYFSQLAMQHTLPYLKELVRLGAEGFALPRRFPGGPENPEPGQKVTASGIDR